MLKSATSRLFSIGAAALLLQGQTTTARLDRLVDEAAAPGTIKPAIGVTAFPIREHTQLGDRLIRIVVLTKLHSVGLRGAADLMPSELSGGMARRVALARAMVMDPDILIYDEPFVGLDPISMGVIARLVQRMNETLGISSIVVSHDIKEIAAVADRSHLISDGRVVASGSPEDLRKESSETVRQFMHGIAEGPVEFHYDAPNYKDQLLGRDQE